MAVNAGETNLSDLRKLGRRFFEGCDLGHFTQPDPGHFPSFPDPNRAKIVIGDVCRCSAEFDEHAAWPAAGRGNLWLGKPAKKFWLPLQAPGTDRGNGQKMNERPFAKRKIAQEFFERPWPARSHFSQGRLDLSRVE